MKTTGVTIRIPEELVDAIDNWVMPNGTYTSRPDFVVSGIRYMNRYVGMLLDKIVEKQMEAGFSQIDLNWLEGEMKEFKDLTQTAYDEYEGKPVTITLRLSPILIDRAKDMNSVGPMYNNFQDFVRNSIIIQLANEAANRILEDFHVEDIRDARANRKIGTVVEKELTDLVKKEATQAPSRPKSLKLRPRN